MGICGKGNWSDYRFYMTLAMHFMHGCQFLSMLSNLSINSIVLLEIKTSKLLGKDYRMAYILNANETHHLPTFATAITNFFKKMGTAIIEAQTLRAERYISQMKF